MNTIREIETLNKRELENSVSPSASWHTDYRDTAYVYIGGLSFELTEGDITTIFSQYGEPVWLKLVRDKETGKSKGFAFLKYEDQRSTDLAVDNLGGATVLGRKLKVDHTRYRKRDDEDDDEFKIAFPAAEQALDDPSKSRGSKRLLEADDAQRRAPRDAITQEHEEEDPMRDYLARERKERHKQRHGSQERQSGDHKHRHRHHHREHKHRSHEHRLR